MYPTLPHAGTFVLHSSLSLRLDPLDRGNLVTAISPLDPSHQVLKRVIGLPGDTVCVDPSGERGRVEEWCKVPPGHVWLAGDNTSNSTDSRDYGPVPIAMIRGRVLAKVSAQKDSSIPYSRADESYTSLPRFGQTQVGCEILSIEFLDLTSILSFIVSLPFSELYGSATLIVLATLASFTQIVSHYCCKNIDS